MRNCHFAAFEKPYQSKKGTLADSSFGGVYVTRTRDPLRDRQVF